MFKTILIVDDDPVQIRLLEGILKDKDYQVTSTSDAPTGLQMAIDKKPDLLLLDVMMPIINGFNFCNLLKSEKDVDKIAIIMLTARDQLDDIQIGLDMGADAYLTKPIDTKELLRTISVVENMKSQESS